MRCRLIISPLVGGEGENSNPSLTAPANKTEVDGKFTLEFSAISDADLEYLEIDHNLGNYGELPAGATTLPEFKLYPNSNPWAPSDADAVDAAERLQTATKQGLEASYDAATKTWKLTFDGTILDQIKTLVAGNALEGFKVYSVVKDVNGNQSGSMNDGSYATTTITFTE